MSDTVNLGVLVVDIHNRAAGGIDGLPVTRTSPEDRTDETGARNPIAPCAAKAKQGAHAHFMLYYRYCTLSVCRLSVCGRIVQARLAFACVFDGQKVSHTRGEKRRKRLIAGIRHGGQG